MEVWGREWTEEWERANTCMFGCSCRDALNCAYLHSPEELQLFKDEKELRVRKLAMRCGFCVRGECRFGPCCARSRRFAAELVAEDSGYESTSASAEGDSSNEGEGGNDEGGDSGGATSELAGSEGDCDGLVRMTHEGWRTDSSSASASSAYCSAGSGDCSGGEGRFVALFVDDDSKEEEITRGIATASMMVDEPGFRFNDGNARPTRREQAAEES